MLRRLFLVFAMMTVVVACSSTPESSGTADEGMLTPPEDRTPISQSDVIYDDATANTGTMNAPGTQEDLVASVGDRIFFGYDSSELDTTARQTLDRQAAWLRTYPNTRVMIEGHADERGTREYNLALGERRANAVKNYLLALGIEGNRVETISYGKERPAVLGSDETAWSRNRRGVMVVQ